MPEDDNAAQVEAVASQLDRPEPPEGLPAAYSCQHGQSNRPCLCHYAAAMMTGQPLPAPLPDDWHETYEPDSAPGLSDKASVQHQ